MNDPTFLECIRTKSIIWLRCGKDHPKFTGIWMVEVNGRVFGRPYYMKERSWFAAFMQMRTGEIKCGNKIWQANGIKPRDLSKIKESINNAYDIKYGVKEQNTKWVEGINKPERVAKTMEFIAQ